MLTEAMQAVQTTLLTDDRLNGPSGWLAFNKSWPRNEPGVSVLLNSNSEEARGSISLVAGSQKVIPEFVSLPACFERGVRQPQGDEYQILLTGRARASLEDVAQAIHFLVARFDLTGLRLNLKEVAPELGTDLRVAITAKDCATPATVLTFLRNQVETAVSWTPAGRRANFLLCRDAMEVALGRLREHIGSFDPEHLPDNPGVRLEGGYAHIWCEGVNLKVSAKLAGQRHEGTTAAASGIGALTSLTELPELDLSGKKDA